MDRGGTITWHIDANDRDFQSTMRRVRSEARTTGRTVDRDINRGTTRANRGLTDFTYQLSKSASFVRNFQVATRGFNMTTMILAVTAATGIVLELGAAVIASSGALLTLPSIMGVVVGAFATTKVATVGLADAFDAVLKDDAEDLAKAMKNLSPAAKDVVKAFADIRTGFKPVQQAVQEAFFTNIGNQMRAVATTSAPVLKAGLVSVATAMNGIMQEAARVAREPFFQGAVGGVLKTTADSANILKGAVEPLTVALAGLLQVGNPFTIMLAQWVTNLSKSLAGYVSSAKGQQEMTAAIELGIDALQKIGNLAGSIAKLFIALFKVSNQEGLSLIDTLVVIVDKMTAWVESAEGQRQMQALLRTTTEILLATVTVIGQVASVILALIEAFDKLPEPVQATVISFLAWVSVLTPIVTYLSAFALSIKTAGLAIYEVLAFLRLWTPLMKVLNLALGAGRSIVVFLARMITTQLVPALLRMGAAFLVAIGPIGWIILAVIAIGAAFALLYMKVKPFREFWQNLWADMQKSADSVVNWFMSSVLPFFNDLWNGIKSGATSFKDFWVGLWWGAQAVFDAVWSAIKTGFGIAVDVFMTIATPFIAVFKAIMFVVGALFTIWVTVWTGILQVIYTIVSTIVQIIGVVLYGSFLYLWNNILTPTYNFFVTIFTAIWNFLVMIFTAIANFIIGVMTSIWNFIVMIANAIWGAVVSIFTAIFNFYVSIWTAIFNFIAGVVTAIFNYISGVFNAVWGYITGVFSSIYNFVSSVWGSIRESVSNAVSQIASAVAAKFNEVRNKVVEMLNSAYNAAREFIPRFLSAGRDMINGLVQGVSNGKDAVVNKIKEICSASLDSVKSFFGIKSPSRVMAKMGNYMMEGLNKGIIATGQAVVNSANTVAQGIAGAFGSVNGQNVTASFNGDVSGVNGAANAVGSQYLNNDNSSKVENNIQNINIGTEVDAQNWLQKLTRDDEITRNGMVGAI